jgi:hypothetical protein
MCALNTLAWVPLLAFPEPDGRVAQQDMRPGDRQLLVWQTLCVALSLHSNGHGPGVAQISMPWSDPSRSVWCFGSCCRDSRGVG